MLIRRATPADLDAVREIHAEAFASGDEHAAPPEVALFDALAAAGDVVDALSLVALVGGVPVGHVVCSRAAVGTHGVVALGPIGVLPRHQRRGVGVALMHAVLGAADALDHPLVALLGAPGYYGRFGFVPASSVGIRAPDPGWGDDFQVRPLSRYDESIRGTFRYAPAFAVS